MKKLFNILLVLAPFYSNTAISCMGRILPDKDFDTYETIFIGQVTGVHLSTYQDRMVTGLRNDPGYNSWTDTTPEYEVIVLPQRLKKGSASEIETLKISGCGILEPKVRQVGLFFIKSNGHVNVIYNGESFDYEDYLEEVGTYYRSKRNRLNIQRGESVNKSMKPTTAPQVD